VLSFAQIILRKFLLLFLGLFIVVGALVYYWMKAFYIAQTEESLRHSIELVSLQLAHTPNLDSFAKEIHQKLDLRVTFIDKDGNVLAESNKDKSLMDNHKDRDEIIASTNKKIGFKIRYSQSVNQHFLYAAKESKELSEVRYIRLAIALKSINDHIFTLALRILGVVALFFIVVFIITYKINISIQAEMQRIVYFLMELTKKKKPSYIHSGFSREFEVITLLLTKVAQILIKKEKQKTKYTAKLERSNRQKDDIISAISHEFKNPIAVINGYAQTLLDDTNINPNIRNKFLEKIFKNGNKLSELIDTLRLSIKLESGQQAMNFSATNLYDLISDSLESVKMSYPKRQAIIKGERDIFINADSALFGVVVTNLIENAFKYSEDEVLIEFSDKELRVVDTGIGISEKDLKNITNKFYRVHANSWNNSLGLGLFIVNNIINLHRFKLGVSSKENEGSTFLVSF
jgi:signal transduction histidine kinase